MTQPPQVDLAETMRRVLGPPGPELTCEECFAELDVFVELELSEQAPDRAVPGMRAHLEGCPACREDHASLHALASGSPGQLQR